MRLVADRIHYAYRPGSDVLHDISLAANDGQALFVLGANGSGKTTLLECLGGIRTPRSGRITIDGIRMTNLSIRDRARRIGVVPQLHEPVFSYTVGQAVLMGRAPHLGLFTHPGVEDRKTVAWALDAVGVEPHRASPLARRNRRNNRKKAGTPIRPVRIPSGISLGRAVRAIVSRIRSVAAPIAADAGTSRL